MRRVACAAMAALIFSASTSARGEGAPLAAHADDATTHAEALAEAAFRSFTAGRHAEAIALYERAYAISPSARMLLDIADIYEEGLHDHARAVVFYRRYVDEPDMEEDLAARARERIAASLERPTPLPLPALAAERPPLRPSSLRTMGFVAGGVGLGAIAIGTALAFVAKAKNDEASRSCVGHACTDPRALVLTDQAAGAAGWADVAFVAGGFFVATGVTLFVIAPSPRGVTVSGTFR